MEWDKIEVFYYVAKAKGFSAAAKQLRLTQPALSRNVAKLEDQLGKRLFIRQAKGGLSFTREGEVLFKLAEKMILDINSTKKIIQGDDEEMAGELRIITTPALGSTWLMYHLSDFLNTYPKISLSVKGILNNLRSHESDAMITTYMSHQPKLIQLPLENFHMQIYANKLYIKKYGAPKSIQDLDYHRIIAFETDGENVYGDTNWILKVGNNPKHRREAYLTVNSTYGLFNAANQGLGIVALAKEDPNVQNSDLINLFPDLEGPSVQIYYIYSKAHQNIKKISSLGLYLQKKIAHEK